MAKEAKQTPTWKCQNLKTGFEPEGTLEAYWEVSLDPISDNYTPQEMDANELFHMWARQVREKYPNGLIPIYWFVDCKGDAFATFEAMPFQFEHFPGFVAENFLTFFTWPVNATTDEPLNWLSLRVKDKLWNAKQQNKGGFIQQATGWKPAILQPHVYLPTLEGTLRNQG